MKLFEAPVRRAQDRTYAALRRRPDCDPYRVFLETMWARFEPYADSHLPISIQSDFVARYWEMYLGCVLLRLGKALVPRRQRREVAGPDLLVRDAGRDVWIEAIAPSGGEGPDAVIEPPLNVAHTIPDEAITLRYCSAVASKHRRYEEWLASGLVSSDDVFIIAVNSGRMCYGMSDIDPPRILKALFPLGDEFVRIDTDGNVIHHGLHYRPVLTKASGVQVSTTTFTNPETAGISAVLFSDERIGWRHDPRTHHLSRLGNNVVLIQNPMSRVPLLVGWLGVGSEFYPVGDENLERKEYPGADDYSGAKVEDD